MEKGIIIFVEGEMDEKILKSMINYLKSKRKTKKFDFKSIDIKNINGITNYTRKTIGFCKQKIAENKGREFIVFLCYDTDAFTRERKPPVNWGKLEKDIKRLKINEIYHIKVEESIEDWILNDKDGLKEYLKLKNIKFKGKNGYEKIKNAFKIANKIYDKTEIGLIDKLDIKKIVCTNCESIKKLCEILDVECKNIK